PGDPTASRRARARARRLPAYRTSRPARTGVPAPHRRTAGSAGLPPLPRTAVARDRGPDRDPARDSQIPHVSRQTGTPGQPRGRGPDVTGQPGATGMTARDDLDRQLDTFLSDGPTELPDPSFYAVRHRTESTRQRVVIGPWRMPDPMNRFAAIGLGTAAVVVALVVGIQILRPSAPGGVGGASSAAPSPTPAPTTASPSTSAASRPTLTQSFTSTMNGCSVSYPAGWIARAATEPWTDRPGDYEFIHPVIDVLHDPVLTDHLFLNIASRPIGDTPPADWMAQQLSGYGCTATEPIAVDGVTRRIGGNNA